MHQRGHGLQPRDAVDQQLVLPAEVLQRVDVRVVEQAAHLVQAEAQLAVHQHLPQPAEVALAVRPVAVGVLVRHQQPDGVPVVQRAHRDAGHRSDLPDVHPSTSVEERAA